MKYFATAIVALVIGFLFGGFISSDESAKLQARLSELEARDCSDAGLGNSLATALSGAALRQNADGPRRSASEEKPAEEEKSNDPKETGLSKKFEVAFGGDGEQPDFDAVGDLMAIRSASSKAAMMEQTDASDEQLEDFEQAVDQMNDDLLNLVGEFSNQVESGDLTRRDGMIFASDMLNIMLDAEDNIGGSFTQEQYDEADSEVFDPFAYLDASVLDSLIGLQP